MPASPQPAARQPAASPRPVLLGSLRAEVERDGRTPGLLESWGESTVIEEDSAVPVLERAAFERLHEWAGIEAEWPRGHAGLVHVYGYLVSETDTRFGLKGERWTGGGVARALDRPEREFLPGVADSSTMLSRITGALLPVLAHPEADGGGIGTGAGTGSGTGPTDGEARIEACVDDLIGDSPGGAMRTVLIRGSDGDRAIVYGRVLAGEVRLITAFPLAPASVDTVIETLLAASPRLRYNAVLPGLAERSALSARRVILPHDGP